MIRLNTTLSEKIALLATKLIIAIIGWLIVATQCDRPSADNAITTKAYQPGKVQYKIVAIHPVVTRSQEK